MSSFAAPRFRAVVLLLVATGTLAGAPGAQAAKPTGSTGGSTGASTGGKPNKVLPTISITAPASGATVGGLISAAGTAADNVAVARVEVSVDGGTYAAATGTTSWTSELDTTTVANGNHTITARVLDNVGNASVSSVAFKVSNVTAPADSAPPTIDIASPADGAGVSRQIAVDGTAGDDTNVAKVEVRLDSGSFQQATGTSSWNATIDASAVGDGEHVVTARATDAVGNVSTATVTVVISSGGAAVQAPAMAAGTIGGFIFKETDRDGVFETTDQPLVSQNIYLYDSAGQFVANTSSDSFGWFRFTGLAAGYYQVRLAMQPYWDLRNDWVPDTTGSLLPRANVALDGTARADLGWRPIVRSTDASTPISSYIGPNGVTVKSFDDVVTAREVYDRLMTGALVGAEAQYVTIRFDYLTAGITTSRTMSNNGVYVDYHATSDITWLGWLAGDNELFHEYGHSWSLYYAGMVQNDPTMAGYLKARGLYGDSRVGSSYAWDVREMVAEDYRQLFGNANAQGFTQMNRDIPPAKDVPGLRDFLSTTFTHPPQ